MSLKTPTRLILSIVCVLVVSAITANADVITVSGTTQGSFDGGAAANNVALGPLTFQGAAFSTPITTGNPAVQVNVGAFNLNPLFVFGVANGHTFNLVVNFSAPPGAPGGPQTFTASLSGVVTLLTADTINVDFNNTPQVFNYTGGTFSFSVADINVPEHASNWYNVVGSITATSTRPPTTPTPEPLSMLLLGTGLAGVATTLRRRRSVKK